MAHISFDCKHLTIRVVNTEKSKIFYIDKLGLELLDEKPNFFVAKAGDLRLSFFGGHLPISQPLDVHIGTSMILSTTNLKATKSILLANGITLKQDIVNANNFLKFLVIEDPDGLILEIAEYLINDMLEKKL